MPSLVLTGYPCSGKTRFAHLLADRALNHKSKSIHHVIIVNEEMARPDLTKTGCYENSNAEKFTRGALKTEFDKYCRSSGVKASVVSQSENQKIDEKISALQSKNSTLVILDSMNYIKGFRYELHCIAKAAGQKHAVIWLLCSQEVAKKWNANRRVQNQTGENEPENHLSYSDTLMDELMQRFEPPDQRNRWDQPLYRVDVDSTLSSQELKSIYETIPVHRGDDSGNVAETILNRSVYNMHSLRDSIQDSSQTVVRTSKASFRRAVKATSSSQIPTDHSTSNTDASSQVITSSPTTEAHVITTVRNMEEIIDELLDSFISDVQPLKQGTSTKSELSACVNVLNDVDSICQEVINNFINSQKLLTSLGSLGGGKVTIPLSEGKTFSMDCKRTLQLIELRRFMRQYIKIISTYPPSDTSRDGISVSFLTYISSQL